MRLVALAVLLMVGCGSVDEVGYDPKKYPYGTCPDATNGSQNFGGYSCDGSDTPADGRNWICGVVDTSKPEIYDSVVGHTVPVFSRRDTDCWVVDISMTSYGNCVATCP